MEQIKPISSKRIPYLDTLRVLACFMVILTHSAMPTSPENGIYLAIISLIASPSPELFLTLSGAILLPVRVEISSFYKKRFLKLLPPLIIWSIIYTFTLFYKGDIDFNVVIGRLVRMPFSPIVGVYWFIYVMIGLYLFAPFISPWINNATKKQLETFLIIWAISLIMPYLNIFIPNIYNDNGSYYWALVNFSGFLGYWILGHYLKSYPIKIGLNKRWLLCISGIILYFLIIYLLKSNNFKMQPFFDNLQIGSALFVIIFFTTIQHFHKINRLTRFISTIASYSFGIYLIHIIVIRHFVWSFFEFSNINPIIETLIIALISFVICSLLVKIISKLPFSKYIIGI